MDASSIVMLIFAVVVLYGGLYVTVSKAVKSSKEKKDNQ
jgi:hypothetical protein